MQLHIVSHSHAILIVIMVNVTATLKIPLVVSEQHLLSGTFGCKLGFFYNYGWPVPPGHRSNIYKALNHSNTSLHMPVNTSSTFDMGWSMATQHNSYMKFTWIRGYYM